MQHASGRGRRHGRRALVALLTATALVLGCAATASANLTGAIYTTNAACAGTNVNIFGAKEDVYLDGGPAGIGSGLPDGLYFVKVTEPDGTLLGISLTPTATVVGGKFASCYVLADLVTKASDGTPGFDTSTNGGHEYKVYVSPTAGFAERKTDNFKVLGDDGGGGTPSSGVVEVDKYFDANANGGRDGSEPALAAWTMRLQEIGGAFDVFRGTKVVQSILDATKDYGVWEVSPNEGNWVRSGVTVTPPAAEVGPLAAPVSSAAGESYLGSGVQVDVADAGTVAVAFGNYCLVRPGGKTLGFWSNKNGQTVYNANGSSNTSLLNAKNLKTVNKPANAVVDFAPGGWNDVKSFLLNGNAVWMKYMLSVQYAAMLLNTNNTSSKYGVHVNPALLVPSYDPDGDPSNGSGGTIQQIMDDANALLVEQSDSVNTGTYRARMEYVKNILDALNNDQALVIPADPGACPYTFPVGAGDDTAP